MNGTVTIAEAGPYSYTSPMTATLIGYARCSTDRLPARARPTSSAASGRTLYDPIPWESCSSISPRPISSASPGMATPAPRGNCAASSPNCPTSATRRETRPRPDALRPGSIPWERCSSISPPPSPSSKPISSACAPARAWPSPAPRGNCAALVAPGGAAQTVRPTAAGTLPHACHRRVFHQRSRRARLRLKTNRLSHAQPVPSLLDCLS